MRVSGRFVRGVHVAWGNPEAVARAGINETFNQEEHFGLDHDDQVGNAMRIGILAGASQTPEAFIEGFKVLAD